MKATHNSLVRTRFFTPVKSHQNIGVWGLGNSGLPLAALMVNAGYGVSGYDPNVALPIDGLLDVSAKYAGDSAVRNMGRVQIHDAFREGAPEPDMVFVATQDHHLASTLSLLGQQRIRRGVPAFILCNGIAGDELQDLCPDNPLYKGALLFPSAYTRSSNGRVDITFNRTREGLLDAPAIEVAKTSWNGNVLSDGLEQELAGLLRRAGLGVAFKETKQDIEFDKLPEILSMAVHALTDTKFKDAADSQHYVHSLTRSMIEEFHAVATKEDKNFDKLVGKDNSTAEDLVEFACERYKRKGNVAGSLAPTLAAGKECEIEAIYGRALSMANKHGIAVPVLDKVHTLLDAAQVATCGRDEPAARLKGIQQHMQRAIDPIDPVNISERAGRFLSMEYRGICSAADHAVKPSFVERVQQKAEGVENLSR